MDSHEILQQYIIGSIKANAAIDSLSQMLSVSGVTLPSKLREAAKARYAIGTVKRIKQYKCGEASPMDLCMNLRDAILMLGGLRLNPILYELVQTHGRPFGLVCESNANVICIQETPKWLPHKKYVEDVYTLSSAADANYEEFSVGDGALQCHTHFEVYKSYEQKLAIYTALRLPPGHTLLISLPTGGGKSLVTQMISSISDGLTVVIVPTVALALDQYHAAMQNMARTEGIFCYRGNQSMAERVMIVKALRGRSTRLLFTSPEAVFKNKELFQLLEEAATSRYLQNIVIDEAHIVPDWGVFFRPDFQVFSVILRKWRQLADNRIRTFLLSATLSDDVVTTLFSLFGSPGHNVQVRCDTLRQEPRFYFYPAKTRKEQDEKTLEAIRLLPKPMVVYVLEPQEATDLQNQLKSLGYKNIPTFTGKTNGQTRELILKGWKELEYDVVIATSAFGIGVDKPDVRTIIHACVPENLSRFYQEVGRGGRDRLPSLSILLPYSGTTDGEGDLSRAQNLVKGRVLRVINAVNRWYGMLKCPTSFVDADKCILDTSATPPYMGIEEAEYAGNQNIAWNINLLLFLYRTGFINLEDAELRSDKNKNIYFITAKLLKPELMGDMDTLVQALEEPRKSELNLQLRGYHIMRNLVQRPASVCWGHVFKELFPLAEEVCNGCPADANGRITTDTKYKLRTAPELVLPPIKPNRRLERRMGSFFTLIISRERTGKIFSEEIVALCKGASLCEVGAIVVPQGMKVPANYLGFVFKYSEFFFAVSHTPYLFASGVLCVFSEDNETNQALFRGIERLINFHYNCLLYCNSTMPIFSSGKALQDCVEGYNITPEKL